MKSRYEKNVPFVHLVFVARGGAEQGRGLKSGRAGGCRAGQGRARAGQGRARQGTAGPRLMMWMGVSVTSLHVLTKDKVCSVKRLCSHKKLQISRSRFSSGRRPS